jgi:hypothetical protein
VSRYTISVLNVVEQEVDILDRRVNRKSQRPTLEYIPAYEVAPIGEDIISANTLDTFTKWLMQKVPWKSTMLTGIDLEVLLARIDILLFFVTKTCL